LTNLSSLDFQKIMGWEIRRLEEENAQEDRLVLACGRGPMAVAVGSFDLVVTLESW